MKSNHDQRRHQRRRLYQQSAPAGVKRLAVRAALGSALLTIPVALLVAFQGVPATNQESGAGTRAPAVTYKAVLDQYCVSCHNEKLRTAGLVLANVSLEDVS